MDSFVAGVDIGGTGTKFGIVDNLGNVLSSDTMSTRGHADIHAYIDELYDKLMVLIDKVGGVGRIKGIGVGAPMEMCIQVPLNMHLTFHGKESFLWQNSFKINLSYQ